MDDSFSANDAERLFQKAIPLSKRRLNLSQLRFALQLVAKHKGIEEHALHDSIGASGSIRRADENSFVVPACMIHSCMKKSPSTPAVALNGRASDAEDVRKRRSDASQPRRADMQPLVAAACMMHSCMKPTASQSGLAPADSQNDAGDLRARSDEAGHGDIKSSSFSRQPSLSTSAGTTSSASSGANAGGNFTRENSPGHSGAELEAPQPMVHMLPSSCPQFCLPFPRMPAERQALRVMQAEQPPLAQVPKAPQVHMASAPQPKNLRGDLQPDGPQVHSNPHSKIAYPVDPYNSSISVEDVFKSLCGAHAEIDVKSWVKMCKRACLIDQTFTSQDARLVFTSVVHMRKASMDRPTFENGLGQIAARKGLEVNVVRRMVSWTIQSSTEKDSSERRSSSKPAAVAPPNGDAGSRTWPEQACPPKLNIATFMTSSGSSQSIAASLSTFRRSHSTPGLINRRRDKEGSSSPKTREQFTSQEAPMDAVSSTPTPSAGMESFDNGRLYASMPLTAAVSRRPRAESQPSPKEMSAYVDYPKSSSQSVLDCPISLSTGIRKKIYSSMPLVPVTVPPQEPSASNERSVASDEPEPPQQYSEFPERPPPDLALLSVPGLAHRRFYPSMPLNYTFVSR